MAEDQWDKVGKLLEEARGVPPDERAAFLEEACEVAPIRKEVLSLLEAEEQAGGFFEGLASAMPTAPSEEEPEQERALQELRTSDPLDLEGKMVGRYAVEEHLGGGGMGIVYKARDPELGRPVALKFLPPHLATSEEAERRFVREARAASALEHPHIATIYEIGRTEEGPRFIAMAYYEGETLKEKLVREGQLPVEEAVGYAEQIAEALGRAHAAGIVHRDVKPANVMVTEAGEVKLVDFGLAKAAAETRLTEPGQRLGTAAYMSPEQAEGKEIDSRADVWALGVLLYETLAGERPFEGERKTAIIHSILREEPPSLRSRRSEMSPALEQVVRQCLRKDPAERYASTEKLLEDLRTLEAEAAPADGPAQPGEWPLERSEEDSAGGPLAGVRWFIRELRRRRVLRVAAVYAGIAFVILQLGEILVEPFGLPPWTLRMVTFLLVLGFPLAVGLTWVFDITEEGLVRTGSRDVPLEKQPSGQKFLTSDIGILALLVVGGLGLGWMGWKTWLGPQPGRPPAAGMDGEPGTQTIPPQGRSGEQALDLDPEKVAVLYFDDNSPGDTLTAFANGFTENLIHRLDQEEGLEVVSQHGVERYRKAPPSLDSIARSLGAGSLIKGSVMPLADSLAVFVQLIDGETQAYLMSDMIRRPAGEVFALQNDLAQEVSRLLRKRLGRQVQLESWQAETQSAEAWKLVERADRRREEAKQLNREGQMEAALGLAAQADSLLTEAASVDPDWSTPVTLSARLVTVRVDPYAKSWGEREREIVRRGIEHANKALGRDSTDTQARVIRGRLRFWLSRQVNDQEQSQTLVDHAERDLRRAIREAPGLARAMHTLSVLLLESRGDFEEARHYAKEAQEADAYLQIPSETHYQKSYTALNEGNFKDAAHWCQTGQRRYPKQAKFRNCELALLATEGATAPDVDRAWELVKEIRVRADREERAFYETLSRLKVAAVLARAGRSDSAQAVLRRTRRDPDGTNPDLPYQRAYAYLLLGEEGRALDLLSRSVRQSPQHEAMAANGPWFKPLRDHPRFQEIVNR